MKPRYSQAVPRGSDPLPNRVRRCTIRIANGTPTGAGDAIGLIANAEPQGTADSTAVLAGAVGKGLRTLGVSATADNTSTNAKAETFGVEASALSREGLATGVYGGAATSRHTQSATGVSGTATAQLSSAIGDSG